MESVILEEVIEEIIDEESVRKAYLNLIKSERALINMGKTLELAKEAARIK